MDLSSSSSDDDDDDVKLSSSEEQIIEKIIRENLCDLPIVFFKLLFSVLLFRSFFDVALLPLTDFLFPPSIVSILQLQLYILCQCDHNIIH